ncbi:restriction endonuclease [Nocardioides sp. MH1]|uniref:restriction endonuclease n=1 Tax=Nocardioides sp. MH1 TaxID=3242490 RepID=UPI0035227A94
MPDVEPPGPRAEDLRIVARYDQGPISEDEVKAAVRDYLVADGFVVEVAWGRSPGIDIVATRSDGRRLVIEVKAEKGVTGAQQHNYFVGMLGELVQRMNDPAATYGIALPDNGQYRGLVNRLPSYARERLGLVVFWVSRQNDAIVVRLEQ